MKSLLYFAIAFAVVPWVLLWLLGRINRRTSSSGPSDASASPRRVAPPLAVLEHLLDVPDPPQSFGYKSLWLAIRTSDAEAVVSSLNLDHVRRANWSSGHIAIQSSFAFVSPPVDGWVFVISHNLPEAGTDDFAPWMEWLSHQHGDVQFFGTHRVVDYHAWSWFRDGDELRTYAWLGERGEVLANRGDVTDEEADLGYEYLETEPDEMEEFPDEEHVMEVAGEWSINPQTLSDLDVSPSLGWVGVLKRSSSV